jgi:hypothetical protein
MAALRDVALLADEWDSKIVAEAGGETFDMVLKDEMISQVKRELLDRPWQKN